MDAEDLMQETFLCALRQTKPWNDEAHEKAWLIVTASNLCKKRAVPPDTPCARGTDGRHTNQCERRRARLGDVRSSDSGAALARSI
ncbi:MAG: hypothetical protein LUC50_01630 [Ruminococcus sp.]|nr:hypothetical protein [Ruminococcus sp.]